MLSTISLKDGLNVGGKRDRRLRQAAPLSARVGLGLRGIAAHHPAIRIANHPARREAAVAVTNNFKFKRRARRYSVASSYRPVPAGSGGFLFILQERTWFQERAEWETDLKSASFAAVPVHT